jgi:hypothetical protein
VAATADIPCDAGGGDEGDDHEVEVHSHWCSDFLRDSAEVVVVVMDVPFRTNDPGALASFGICAEVEVGDSCDRTDAEAEIVAAAAAFHLKCKVWILSREDPIKKLLSDPTASKNSRWTF